MEKIDFLAPDNDCGQSLLKLAAAGSTILAELLRLSNHIPDVFLFESRKAAQVPSPAAIQEAAAAAAKVKDKSKKKGPQPLA